MPLKIIKIPQSQNWYIRGTVAGRLVFESAGTRDRQLAEAKRARLESRIYREVELGLDASDPVSFAEAAHAYMTATGRTKFMAPIIRHFGAATIDRIGQAQADQAADQIYPGTKPATRVRMAYTPIIAVLNFAAARKMPGAAPPEIVKPKIARTAVEWLTDDELKLLLPHCNPRLAALILLMTDTGCRVGEAIRLTRHAFTRRAGHVYLGKTKNGKPRLPPLIPSTAAAITAIMPAEPFARVFGYGHRTSVNTAIARACRRAGLARSSPHRLGRHSFAARLLGAGHSLKLVQQAGGWESMAVVADTYGHLEQSQADDAMRQAAQAREKSVNPRRPRAKKPGK